MKPKTSKRSIAFGYKKAPGMYNMPANPPDAPAIAQPRVLTVSTLIPDNLAISGE